MQKVSTKEQVLQWAKEIGELKQKTTVSLIKIGEILHKAKRKLTKGYKKFLSLQEVNYHSTQAKKYINVYLYHKRKSEHGQSTDYIKKIGIEKIYHISRVRDEEKQVEVENWITQNKKISVNRLAYIVRLLNKCPELTFDEALQKVSDNKKDNLKYSKAILLNKYKKLKTDYDKLEEENRQLKAQLKLPRQAT